MRSNNLSVPDDDMLKVLYSTVKSPTGTQASLCWSVMIMLKIVYEKEKWGLDHNVDDINYI